MPEEAINTGGVKPIVKRFSSKEEFADEVDSITVALFTTQCAIENNLRIVEVPITFKERKGTSKSGVTQKDKALRYGLQFIKFILTS